MPQLKTCEVCGWTWDPHPWTKCPRCVAQAAVFEPTLEEIRAACIEIQKTWSRSERNRRCQSRAKRVNTPMCELVWTTR